MMSGIICCCFFNISHFSSTVYSAAMAKRAQQDSGEERVTAKSRPMMNLTARMPSVVSSSASVIRVKRYYGKQDPWKSVVAEDRSGQPERFSSTDNSKLDYDRAWSSQELKNEVTTHDRSEVNLIKLLGEWYNKFVLITKQLFSDGTAQSVRYGEPLRDRSGQLDNVNS